MHRLFVCLLVLLSCVITPASTAKAPPPTILVAGLADAEVAGLREAAPGVSLIAVADEEEALQHIDGADAVVGVVSEELLRRGEKLQWVHVYSAGVDRYRFPALVDRGISFTNSKILQGANVADQAMALLLVLTRRVHLAVRRPGDFRGVRASSRDAIELSGKTALVVGLGGIGTAIAERAAGFGMKVVGIKRTLDDKPEFVASIHRPDELLKLLPQADVVFLAVPLTAKTTGLIGAEEFAAMKEGAYIVNIARGRVIETDALVAALDSGRLAGAGLDVTEPEPLPADHPLWSQPNAVITPHMGGTSDRVSERRIELVKRNIRHFVAAEPLENVVDKAEWY